MKNKRILLLLIIIIIFFIFSIIFSLLNFGSTEIASGISVGNINISKFSKESSIQLLNELISQRDEKELTLVYTTENNIYLQNHLKKFCNKKNIYYFKNHHFKEHL